MINLNIELFVLQFSNFVSLRESFVKMIVQKMDSVTMGNAFVSKIIKGKIALKNQTLHE